jgi:hypothetical protein
MLVVAAGYVVVIVFFVVRTGALTWVQMGWPAGTGRVSRLLSAAGFRVDRDPAGAGARAPGSRHPASILDVQPTGRIPPVEGVTATILVVLGAAVVAPVAEEIFFRGFALSAWQRDLAHDQHSSAAPSSSHSSTSPTSGVPPSATRHARPSCRSRSSCRSGSSSGGPTSGVGSGLDRRPHRLQRHSSCWPPSPGSSGVARRP